MPQNGTDIERQALAAADRSRRARPFHALLRHGHGRGLSPDGPDPRRRRVDPAPPPPEARTNPVVIGYRGDPATAFGLRFETVEAATDLGPAPGWLIPGAAGRDDGRTAAVFVHGIFGAREDGYAFVAPLHEAGVPVLLIAYRGDAEAPPDPLGLHSFGLTE